MKLFILFVLCFSANFSFASDIAVLNLKQSQTRREFCNWGSQVSIVPEDSGFRLASCPSKDNSEQVFGVFSFDLNGSLDESNFPQKLVAPNTDAFILDMKVDSKGRSVVLFVNFYVTGEKPALMRVQPNGKTDKSFGKNGILFLTKPVFNARRISIDEADRILVHHELSERIVTGTDPIYLAVSRVTREGRIDFSYDKRGYKFPMDRDGNKILLLCTTPFCQETTGFSLENGRDRNSLVHPLGSKKVCRYSSSAVVDKCWEVSNLIAFKSLQDGSIIFAGYKNNIVTLRGEKRDGTSLFPESSSQLDLDSFDEVYYPTLLTDLVELKDELVLTLVRNCWRAKGACSEKSGLFSKASFDKVSGKYVGDLSSVPIGDPWNSWEPYTPPGDGGIWYAIRYLQSGADLNGIWYSVLSSFGHDYYLLKAK